jgi:tRNA U34 5-methylaminomethyl-2-thiouridine-forming methyltransferase MnmC
VWWQSVANRQKLPTVEPNNISALSFPFSPFSNTDIREMLVSWGLDISSTSQKSENAIEHFKNLDFN